MHSHSTNTGLAFVVIVTGDAFCVVVPYGLGLCCRDLAITGLAFAIIAGMGIALASSQKHVFVIFDLDLFIFAAHCALIGQVNV